jgi:DNA invertase Pin-like site-specific DNA recombinase
LETLDNLRVGFISLSECIDMSTPTGKMVVTVLGAVAQLEREITVERVRTGLRNAVSKGKRLGRKRTRNSELIRSLRAQGLSYRKIAALAKCSVATVAEELMSHECSEIQETEQKRAIG